LGKWKTLGYQRCFSLEKLKLAQRINQNLQPQQW